MVNVYLDDISPSQSDDGFESKFHKFLDEIIENEGTELRDKLKQSFWAQFNANVLQKFAENEEPAELKSQIDKAQSHLQIIRRFCHLFLPFWQKTKSGNKSNNLFNLVQLIFSKFVNKFNEILKRGDFLDPPNEEGFNAVEDLACAYLKSLNLIFKSFLHIKLIRSFAANLKSEAENDSDLKFVDELIISTHQRYIKANSASQGAVKTIKKTLLFNVIDLFSSLNPDLNASNKLDHYLFEIDNSSIDLIDLFEHYFGHMEIKLDPLVLIWFRESEKFYQNFLSFLDHMVNEAQMDPNVFNLLFKFSQFALSLDGNDASGPKSNLFYDALIKTISSLFRSSSAHANKLNCLIHFSTQIIFNKQKKFVDQSPLWQILISCCCLRQEKNQRSNQQLQQFTRRVSQNLFDLITEKSKKDEIFENLNDYQQLIGFVRENLGEDIELNKYFDNEAILLDLVCQFANILGNKQNGLEQFYHKILLQPELTSNFKKIFKSFIEPTNNVELLVNFYLDDEMNAIYSNHYSNILSKKNQKMQNNLVIQSLKQINFTLKILNFYAELGKDKLFEFKYESWWYYLILSAYVLGERLEPGHLFDLGIESELKIKLQTELKEELGKFVTRTKFPSLLIDALLNDEDNFDDFAQEVAIDDKDSIEFNDFSLICFIFKQNEDSNLMLKKFSNKLMNKFKIANEYNFYLNDFIFAKFDLVNRNGSFDEEKLVALLEKHRLVLETCFASLKNGATLETLKEFNFSLNMINKCSKIYFQNLRQTIKEKSNEFVLDTFGKILMRILNIFIDLKTEIKSYCFYFNFERVDINETPLEFEKINLLNKFNTFLTLFFTDFKIVSLNYMQQISQSLNDKHWDFLLCYSAAIVQQLNKLNTGQLIDNTKIQLLSIHYFNFGYKLIRSMQTRVKYNKPGTYLSSVYSDWMGFFAKEIFDPFLCLYVKSACFYSEYFDDNRSKCSSYLNVLLIESRKKAITHKLCSIVSLVPIERLIFNDLEAKLNVFDLDFESLNLKSAAVKFSEPVKTVINHLVPYLKHQLSSVQLAAYKILRVLARNTSNYYVAAVVEGPRDDLNDANYDEENNKLTKNSIFNSLPYVIRETLSELTVLFADVKNSIQFDQNILLTGIHEVTVQLFRKV